MKTSPAVPALLLILASCASSPVDEPTEGFSKPVGFSILEDYDKGQDLSEVESDFLLFKELGIDTWRGSFGWDDYEPAPDEYDYAWLHQFVQLAARHRISLRPYLGYTPEWAARPGGKDAFAWNNPPADVNDWYAFVYRTVSELRHYPHVLSFEIYNEENAPMWWDGSAEEYSRVLKSGSAAIREASGEHSVLLGGLTYPDLDWIQALCGTFDSGHDFDILPIHAYPETWTPEAVDVENYLDDADAFQATFVQTADEECGRKPIWVNELGYATTPGKRDERDQANWWARAFATFLAEPRIVHLGIYEIREPERTVGVIGEQENYFLGLTRRDGSKKLAFHTVKRLIDLLDTGTLTVADGQTTVKVTKGRRSNLYYHLFIRPDGKQVLFVWNKTDSPVVQITLPRPGTRAVEYTLAGTESRYGDFRGRILANVALTPGEVRIFSISP